MSKLKLLLFASFFLFLFPIALATTETRYLQKETWDATYKKLTTTQDDTTYEFQFNQYAGYVSSASWGIRVFVNNTGADNKTEYKEITGGSPVATVTRIAVNAKWAVQTNNTYGPSETALNSSDALVIKWYTNMFYYNNGGSTGWQEIMNARSRTEALNANYINASTWTVSYYTKLANYTGAGTYSTAQLAYDGNSESTDYYPTKIANIIWNPVPASTTTLTISGQIPFTFSISDRQTTNWQLGGAIPITLNSRGSLSVIWNFGGSVPISLVANGKEDNYILIGFFGSIPFMFDFRSGHDTVWQLGSLIPFHFIINSSVTLPILEDIPVLFIGMLTCFGLVGLCIVMIRRRKQT